MNLSTNPPLGPNGPATDEEIRAAEAQMGRALPEPLKRLLLTKDGGVFERHYWLQHDGDTWVAVEELLSLKDIVDSALDVEQHCPSLGLKIPFAIDGGGNLWFLDADELTVSMIFLDDDQPDERPTGLQLDEFLTSLLKDEPAL